jgi:hypothetical protein
MADYELICSKMSQLRRKGNKAMALCPAHDDKSHSLSILYREADDRVLLHCFAQDCSAGSILSAVGLAWQHIYPKDRGDYTPRLKRHTREQVKSAEWLLELVPLWSKEGVAFTEKDRADIYEAQRIVNSARGNDERVD